MSAIPIFYYHEGRNSYYLPYTINQTRYSNPGTKIIFLGDETNQSVTKYGVEHVNAVATSVGAKELANLYVHLSLNNPTIEEACIRRWIVLNEYVQAHEINGMFTLLDSDVMLYMDITVYMNRYFCHEDVALSGEFGPGYVTFRNRCVLQGLVDYIFAFYKDKQHVEQLRAEWNEKVQHHTGGLLEGISDMVIINEYLKNYGISVLDMTRIRDGACFDTHMGQEKDLRFPPNPATGNKDIVFRNGQPYCTCRQTGDDIRFLALHFQGARKEIMYRYYTGPRSLVPGRGCAFARRYWQKTKRLVRRWLGQLRRIA